MLKRLGVIGLVLMATSGIAFAEADQEQGWLGVHLGRTSSVLQRHLGIGENTGFVIMKVMEDTPAERAGLQAHDVVTAINGQEVNGVKEAVDSITSAAPGDTVSITLLRDGEEQTVDVVLGSRPSVDEMGLSFDFDFDSDDHHPMRFRWHGLGEGTHLSEILEKAGVETDITFGNISVQVECEDGKGTVTVTNDGETETHEFDCTDMAGHEAIMLGKLGGGGCMGGTKMFGMPHLRGAAPNAKSFTIELDGEGDEGNVFAQVIRLHSQPKTSFNVTSNGEITVTVRKGEDELVLTFKDADDLAESRPDLDEKYQDLLGELEE